MINQSSEKVATDFKITRPVTSLTRSSHTTVAHYAKVETKPISIFLILIWIIFGAGMVAHYYSLF